MCSAFRNEGAGLSSELIREACAATVHRYGAPPPPHGMVTFVNVEKVRGKPDPGYCFLRAGFERDGETQGGLLAFVLRPEKFPPAEAALGAQLPLLGVALKSESV